MKNNNNAKTNFDKKEESSLKSKGFKPNRKGFKSLPKRGKQFNDKSWYLKNPSITDAFAKIPFNWIVGHDMPGLNGRIKFPAIVSYIVDWAVANRSTLVALDVNGGPSILNQVATIIYTTMRRANAGATNDIEYADVIISNLLASIDICANAHYINRFFNIANTFSWKNRIIPDTIIEDHFGLDLQDFVANQANYRGQYDRLVAKAKTIKTLSNFPFVDAIMAEFNEVFKDSDTDTGRESIIVSVKAFHHIYDPIGSSDLPGGQVRLMKLRDLPGYESEGGDAERILATIPRDDEHRMKFQLLLDIFETQINALIDDSDFNLIQADIEKAFGDQSGYITIDKAPDNPVLTPVYSGEFNCMFSNGKFINMPETWNLTQVITANPEQVIFGIKDQTYVNTIGQMNNSFTRGKTRLVSYNWVVAKRNEYANDYNLKLNVVNLDSNDPSVDDVVISTRYRHDVNVYHDWDESWLSIPESLKYNLSGGNADLYLPRACSNFICFGHKVTLLQISTSGCLKESTYWDNVTTAIPTSLLSLECCPTFINSGGNIYTNVNNMKAITGGELDAIQVACFLSLWDLPSRTNI